MLHVVCLHFHKILGINTVYTHAYIPTIVYIFPSQLTLPLPPPHTILLLYTPILYTTTLVQIPECSAHSDDLPGHICELELGVLVGGQGLPELTTLLGYMYMCLSMSIV